MSILFALLAAFANATNSVTQRVASKAAPARARGWRLAPYLVTQPLWLLGGGAGLASFVCQALALNHGQLSVVQPLLVTELVFALLLRRLWIHDTVRAAAWGSAALTCVALAAFLVVAEPRGGRSAPPAQAWVGALAVFGGAVIGLTVCGRSGSPGRRAGLYATAAAVVWALEATFIKAATETLTGDSILAMLTDWPVYAIVIGGIVGTVLTQAALHVGPLSVSQPLIVVVDPIVSIVLSVWVFAERFTDSPATITVGALSFSLMIIGVVLLTATGPRGAASPNSTGVSKPGMPASLSAPLPRRRPSGANDCWPDNTTGGEPPDRPAHHAK